MIIISHRLNRAFDLGQILNSLTSVLREVRNCITSKSSIAVSSALCVDFLQLSLRSHNDHTGLGNDLLLVSLVDVAGQGGDQQGGQDGQDNQNDDELDQGEALLYSSFC